MATPTYHPGDHVRSLVHRHGILPITPATSAPSPEAASATTSNPMSWCSCRWPGGAVHTSFGPDEIAAVR